MTGYVRHVTFVTPWLPQYRVPFFERLRASLEAESVELRLLYGAPPRQFAARSDSADLPWAEAFPLREFGVRDKRVRLTPFVRKTDLLVMEQHMKQLTLFGQFGARMVGLGPPVALWGHGDGGRTIASSFSTRLKDLIAKLPDLWLVYTEAGAAHLVQQGVRDSDVVVFNNTIDASDLSGLGDSDRRLARRRLEIPEQARVALHIGGLDEAKRLDLLIETADLLEDELDDFVLLVAGAGSGEQLVRSAASMRKHIHFLGPRFGPARRQIFAAADALLHPGKVGLVAIDSFASGRPLITASGQIQAPEFDYLNESNAAIADEPDAEQLAAAAVDLFSEPGRLELTAENARASYNLYPLSAMVDRVSRGISDFLTL